MSEDKDKAALQPPERIILHPETLRRMHGYIYLPEDKEANNIDVDRVAFLS